MKTCQRCHTPRELSAFNRNKRAADGYQAWCRSCAKAYTKGVTAAGTRRAVSPESRRQIRYGLSEDVYRGMLLVVDYSCPLCLTPFSSDDFNRNAVVDHDHSCCPGSVTCGQCVRGLLCRQCNMLIGKIEKMGDVQSVTARIETYLRNDENRPEGR